MSLFRAGWCRRIGAVSFLYREDGALTALAIVLFVVLVAFGGLAIDLGRLYSEHGQMQDFVDHVALASAAELDGNPGAIDRATKAAVQIGGVGPLVNGKQNFADGPSALAVSKVTFLSKLGSDPGPTDVTPVTGVDPDVVQCTYTVSTADYSPTKCDANSDVINASQFVEVVTTNRQVTYYVLPVADLFLSIANRPPLTANVQLKATAGFVREICNNTPMMVCNPAEVAQAGAKFSLPRGTMITPKENWGPGDFGLTNNFPGNGASDMADAMAKLNPNTTCVRKEVGVEPGQKAGPVYDGLNTRFDMYKGLENNNDKGANAADYAPAANVLRGMASCSSNPPTSSALPFPRDNCFMAAVPAGEGTAGSGCTNYMGTARYGDGNWARTTYWNANHPMDLPPAGYSAMTRYDVYRYEIMHFAPDGFTVPASGGSGGGGGGGGKGGGKGGPPPPPPPLPAESSAPSCSKAAPYDNPEHDRRVLYVAIVNCLSQAQSNNSLKVIAWAKVFMTEPVGGGDTTPRASAPGLTFGPTDKTKDIFVEYDSTIEPGDLSDLIHQYPVLYR